MVNDFVLDSDNDGGDNEEDDEDRQALGEMASSSTKWHKHTVRVFNHLKKCIHDGSSGNTTDADDADDADADAEQTTATPKQKPDSVNFHELTKHVVSRRNASSVFFEMLQLKTWDFIELDQDKPYGDISISAGV